MLYSVPLNSSRVECSYAVVVGFLVYLMRPVGSAKFTDPDGEIGDRLSATHVTDDRSNVVAIL